MEQKEAKFKLGLWEVTETPEELEQLFDRNTSNLPEFAGSKVTRLTHYLASRLAAQQMFPGTLLLKDAFGKPVLENSPWKISLSHAGSYAAVAGKEGEETGVDIELVGEKVRRVASKFCNAAEQLSVKNGAELETLHLIWGAKEAMYKWYGKKEVDFKAHLAVQPFDLQSEGNLLGSLSLPTLQSQFKLGYRFFKGYCLVWVESSLVTLLF